MTPQHFPSDVTPAALHRLAMAELSPGSRLRYVALLLAAAVATSVVAALLVTEPALPMCTRAALLAMTGIGAAWVAFATWVLRSRRPLLAWHRVIAARMAVGFCGVYAAAAAVATLLAPRPAAFGALVAGLVMLATAIAMLVGAGRRHAQLLARRDALERELGRSG